MKKKLLTFLLLVAMFVSVLFAGQALQANAEDAYSDGISAHAEEKLYCKATLDNDFTDDTVLVVLSKAASLGFKAYAAADFPEARCAVEDMTESTMEMVKQQIAEEKDFLAV